MTSLPAWTAPFRALPRRVPVGAPEEVTTVGPETPPDAGGLSRAQVDRIWQAVLDWYGMGLHPAIGLVVRRHGRAVLHRTLGHARGNGPEDPPGTTPELATPDTLFNMFSASKCLLAMLVHQADDDGLLHVGDPVVEYIPEFGRHGKGDITLAHLLSHRAGVPAAGNGFDLDRLHDRAYVVDYLCNLEPLHPPGRRLAYHALTSGMLLGEILHRVTGVDVGTLLRERVSEPLGFKTLRYGVDPTDLPRVATESFTGPFPQFGLDGLLTRSLGVGIRQAVALANDPRFLTGVVPSGNIVGNLDEIGLAMELLLRGGTLQGTEVFSARTVRRATSETSYRQLDGIILLPVRYGNGFMLGSEHLSFYGDHTPRAFGHLGFTNVMCWADPERDISVAFLNNGKPFLTPELLLWLRIMRVISATVPREFVGRTAGSREAP